MLLKPRLLLANKRGTLIAEWIHHSGFRLFKVWDVMKIAKL